MYKRKWPAPAPAPVAPATQKDALLQEIARERREIRILESERSLLLGRFARRPPMPPIQHAWTHEGTKGWTPSLVGTDGGTSNNNNKGPRLHFSGNVADTESHGDKSQGDNVFGGDNERDLLDVLDALQCRTTLEAMASGGATTKPPPSSTSASCVMSDGDAAADPAAASSTGFGGADPDSCRLHPLLGGVVFTKVEGPLPPAQGRRQDEAVVGSDLQNNERRVMYILSGHTSTTADAPGDDGPGSNPVGCIGFEVRTEVSFAVRSVGGDDKSRNYMGADGERATVSSVETKFFPHAYRHASIVAPNDTCTDTSGDQHAADGSNADDFFLPFPEDELQELSELVSKTRSLTQLFRELVAFKEFHRDRSASMERLVTEFGAVGSLSVSVICADMVMIRSTGSQEKAAEAISKDGDEVDAIYTPGNASGAGVLHLRLSWSRSFSELGGEDDLCVEDCAVGDDRTGNGRLLVDSVLDPDGISSLVHCAGGIEGAIRAILRAVAGSRARPRLYCGLDAGGPDRGRGEMV